MSDDPKLTRPPNLSKRDLLVGLLVATLVDSKVPCALDIAAKACEPLFGDYLPDMRRWYPVLDSSHAKAAIAYAGRALRYGALTQDEYDWICDKTRKAILSGKPDHPFALADFPGRLGAARHGDDDGPEAA